MKTLNLKPRMVALVILFTIHCSLFTSVALAGDYNIVPLPQSISLQKGEPFTLDATVQILAPSELQQEAIFLQIYLRDLVGIDIPVAQKRDKKGHYIELAVSPKVSAQEGYVLTVSSKGVTVQ